MRRFIARASRFVPDLSAESGQSLSEYGLITALIAVACMGALGLLGLALAGRLDALVQAF